MTTKLVESDLYDLPQLQVALLRSWHDSKHRTELIKEYLAKRGFAVSVEKMQILMQHEPKAIGNISLLEQYMENIAVLN